MPKVIGQLQYYIARIFVKMKMSAIYNSKIHPTSAVEAGSQIVDSTMERHSFCGYNCTFLKCDIGQFCSIADDVYVGGSHHPIHFISTSPVFLSHRDSVKAKFSHHDYSHQPRTTIGHDVWIGHGAKLKSGITVGHGSVIGMGSIVTKDVAPYSIVAGNPARFIRMRFDEKTVVALLKSEWWTRDDNGLRDVGKYCDDPQRFLEQEGLL